MHTHKKVIPFGTKHNVRVESVSAFMMVVASDEIKEGFVLMAHGLQRLPNTGSKGTITFVKGGPAGGHWKFNPSPPHT